MIMEKYDNIVKSSEIRKLVDNKMYEKALTILDTMDVSKVKNVMDLSLYTEVYIQMERYEDAKKLLVKIHSRSNSRRVIKQLIRLALKTRNIEDAEEYYDEYVEAAPRDPDRYILRYRIDRMKNEDISVLIKTLETLKKYDYLEKWCYELAKLYHRAGMEKKCIKECSDLILWFGEGPIVEKAKLLKAMYKEEDSQTDNKLDNLSKNEKTLENEEDFEYNHKSLQDIPEEGKSLADYEYIYNNEQLNAIYKGYFEVEEMKVKIAAYLDEAIKQKTASSFAIVGFDAKGRISFAKSMAKGIHELHIFESSRLAKIHASKLNELALEENYDKLKDSFLVIEDASMLSESLQGRIAKMLETMQGHVVVILQDEEQALTEFFEKNEEFSTHFATTFEVVAHTKDELVAMALNMFEEAEFELDEEAKVCLETACNQIAVNVIDKERVSSLTKLVEAVFERAEERSMHDIALSQGVINYDNSDINKIIASDF